MKQVCLEAVATGAVSGARKLEDEPSDTQYRAWCL
jgi:hypothetical protein